MIRLDKSILFYALGVALIAAALSAWIASPSGQTEQASRPTAADRRAFDVLAARREAARKLAQLRNETSDSERRTAAETVVDYRKVPLPSMDRVRRERLVNAPPPRADIVRRGIDALVPELTCAPLYAMVRDGREGPGGLGCVEIKQGTMVPLGHWAHRSETGDLETGEYHEGQRTGVWRRYSKDGALREQGRYEGGERQGAWDEFSTTGEHLARRTYLDGAFHGITVLYNRAEPTIEMYERGELVATKSGFDQRSTLAMNDEELE